MLDFIYQTEQLYFEDLYQFPPFDKEDANNLTPANIIQFVLTELSKTDDAKQVLPNYRQTIFNKICALIQQNTVNTFFVMDSAGVLLHIAQLMTSGSRFELPIESITLLFNHFYANRVWAHPVDLSNVLRSITKLVQAGYIMSFNSRILEQLFDQLHYLRGYATTESLAYGLWSVAKLVVARKLTHIKSEQITEINNQFCVFLSSAKTHEISMCLWSIAKLTEATKLVTINSLNLQKLLAHFCRQIDQASHIDFLKVLSAITLFIENGQFINEISPNQIVDIFIRLESVASSNSYFGDGLSLIGKLIVANQVHYAMVKKEVKKLFNKLKALPEINSYALTCGLKCLAQIALVGERTRDHQYDIDSLFSRLHRLRFSATPLEIADSLASIAELNTGRQPSHLIFTQSTELFEVLSPFADTYPDYVKQGAIAIEQLKKLRRTKEQAEVKEVKTENSENPDDLLQFIYRNENITVEQLYDYISFDNPKKKYPGNAIRYALIRLSSAGNEVKYKKEIFIILCKWIKEHINIFSTKDCSISLFQIVTLLRYHLKKINPPIEIIKLLVDGFVNGYCIDAVAMSHVLWCVAKLVDDQILYEFDSQQISTLFDRLHANRKNAPIDSICRGLWAIAKLVYFQQVLGINADDVHRLIEIVSRRCRECETINLDNTLWAIAKLAATGKLTNINSKQIKIIFDEFYTRRNLCSVKQISSTLWAIAKLVSLGELQTFIIDDTQVEQLLERVIKLDSAKPRELGDILWSLGVLKENGIVATIKPKYVTTLFSQINPDYGVTDSFIKALCAFVILIEPKQMRGADIKQVEKLFASLPTNRFLKFVVIVNSFSAIAKLIRDGVNIKIDSDQVKSLLSRFNSRFKYATQEELLAMEQSLQVLVSANKIMLPSTDLRTFNRLFAERFETVFEPEMAEIKAGTPIRIEKNRIPAEVITFTNLLKVMTGKNIFLGGSAAANAGLPKKNHQSDYDLKFGDDEEKPIDEEVLIAELSKLGICERIDNEYPTIKFTMNIGGIVYRFDIAKFQKKKHETEDSAMLRSVCKGGMNIESLYIPLTGNDTTHFEIKGSEHDLSAFKRGRISVVDRYYIHADPKRALRIGMKTMDFPDFKLDENVKEMLRNPDLKVYFQTYLTGNENNNLHVGQFSTTLETWLSRHRLRDVVTTMEQLGILSHIFNLPTLTFADLEPTLAILDSYDKDNPCMKRIVLNQFFLAHFCAKHKFICGEEARKSALANWQLYGVIRNAPNPYYLDFIERKMFGINTETNVDIQEKNFLDMIEKIEASYGKQPEQKKDQSGKIFSVNNNDPLFAHRRHPVPMDLMAVQEASKFAPG